MPTARATSQSARCQRTALLVGSSLLLSGALLTGPRAHAAMLTVMVTDASGAALPDAAVAVEVKGTAQKVAASAAASTAEMSQRNRAFAPHVLVVQAGTPVNFPNFDTVRHHVYSFSPIKTFEIKLYAGVPTAPIVFDKPGTAVLGCNIHDRMNGFIHVVNTPYFGKTDSAGQVQIDLPAGEHQLRVWHPLLGQDGLPQVLNVKIGSGPASVAVNLKP